VIRRFVFGALLLAAAIPTARANKGSPLAHQVTIHRDEWGVPQVDGPRDERVVFGFCRGSSQCRDSLARGVPICRRSDFRRD
jgi:acyl-homoserine lactone acylase PvdQ